MKKELIRTERYIHIFDEAGKQLAHLPLNDSPILEGVPLLPPIDEQSINTEIAVKELLGLPTYLRVESMSTPMETAFNFGVKAYNKAREKYKFTEEHAKYLFECGRNFQINADITFTVAREHLLQPKSPTHFEFEVVWHNTYGSETQQYDAQELKIKTTTNSQGQVVACGKYIY